MFSDSAFYVWALEGYAIFSIYLNCVYKVSDDNSNTGLQIRVRIGNLFSLFLIQNICCGYSKEPSQ